MTPQPLVSCIMPTANRRQFVPRAIEYFLAQDYSEKELIVLDDGEDSVEDLVPAHTNLRYLRRDGRLPVGTKRNIACEAARGEIVVHWDDDDWSAPWRIRYQVQELLQSGADVCGLDHVLFCDPAQERAWEYVYPRGGQPWVHGATLCYRKSFWQRNRFPDVNVGEDSRFVWNARSAQIRPLAENRFFVGMVHGANTSPKHCAQARWQPKPIELVRTVMREKLVNHRSSSAKGPNSDLDRPSALVTAAFGIGDILRVTPLIRVLDRLGYRVDVLLAPDFPETVELLRGAPEINRLLHYPGFRSNRGARPLPELADGSYRLAVFTVWSAPFAHWVRAEAREAFDQATWVRDGDIASVERIARRLGWREALPAPFAMTSGRKFDLPPDAIALHPGCKADWPWKKWHGFAELAAQFGNVVVVGSPADLDNRGTYFGEPFRWPTHVLDYVGKLGLRDTAALIRQCAALVSNDSGLMHLGVALDVPTFGVFGITSPQRELMSSPRMFPVTKNLPCEPACRQQPWGRRDCERHLECLKTLTAPEVATRVRAELSRLVGGSSVAQESKAVEEISINYYGYVFDATGYGQAARSYIHALVAAGVKVSVVDIGSRPRQVHDELAASLLGRDPQADFNLFHGIPSQWAHLAYPLKNVIAMTVWETDAMPLRWRNPLSHAIDVWLPCAFNVEVFGRALGCEPFRLPHCVPQYGLNGVHCAPLDLARLHIAASDFVFYSIFEWQDRKNPQGVLHAFLQAFRERNDAVLVIKTNPGALAAARQTVQEARAATGSQARVQLCCEAWTDAQLQALHQRGECYVSLHKGEGWGYPLFEAACRGKAVVATGFSGPMDYLDPERHFLVRHAPGHVRQAYAYYHPSMRWAEPDLAHAAEGIRRTYDNRDKVLAGAAAAATRLKATFSAEAVGNAAKARLLTLLRQATPAKFQAIDRQAQRLRRPAVPISGEWYDADYFEHGLKSNWEHGYTWAMFGQLFRDTAAYLKEMFPEARSFLDIGCAKGFLVRALRESGEEVWGFDHSAWAIRAAESAAKPYVTQASVESVLYERRFDVLVAMSILETLTEDQVCAFLARARAWSTQAIIATIPTVESEANDPPPAWNDRDLSHITLRSRQWWSERFIAAGWRQDALHRVVERACQRHALPSRMGWSVYVYAPGH